MPPMEPPITEKSWSMPKWSISGTCASTMSPTVMTGKSMPQGLPVSGLMLAGPVEPMQPPSTLGQMMKNRSVSIGLPGPTMVSHQPGLAVTGWGLATYWSPVSACVTRMAFDLSALSSP